jgi:hypothetical protein
MKCHNTLIWAALLASTEKPVRVQIGGSARGYQAILVPLAAVSTPGYGPMDGLDRPGDLGGSDPWEDAESCLHSGSTPMSCANAR